MTSSAASRAAREILGQRVERAAALPPATGVSADLFSVDGGSIELHGFYGLVTAAIPNVSLDFDLAHDPDNGGSDVVLATLLAVDNLGVGSYLTLNATLGSALVTSLNYAVGVALAKPVVLGKGDIKLNVAGGGAVGTTARVKWGLWYVAVEDGAVVTAV